MKTKIVMKMMVNIIMVKAIMIAKIITIYNYNKIDKPCIKIVRNVI